jgi:hypothetical protein
MRKTLIFVAGLLLGSVLSQSHIAEAANRLMFGSFSGAAKAVTVTTEGYVNVVLN